MPFLGGQPVGILYKSFPLLRKPDGFLRQSCVGVGKRFVFGGERRISLGQPGVFGIEFIVPLPYLLVNLRKHFLPGVEGGCPALKVLHLALQ